MCLGIFLIAAEMYWRELVVKQVVWGHAHRSLTLQLLTKVAFMWGGDEYEDENTRLMSPRCHHWTDHSGHSDMPVLRLSSPVVTDLWSCSLPGPLGPTDGYIPYRDQRTYDTQNSYSLRGFFPPQNSQGACWFEQTECKRKISSWIEFSFRERKLWFVCLLNLI